MVFKFYGMIERFNVIHLKEPKTIELYLVDSTSILVRNTKQKLLIHSKINKNKKLP